MPIENEQNSRVLWLSVIQQAQKEASGFKLPSDAGYYVQRNARRWLVSCMQPSGWRSCRDCAGLKRVGELAGLNEAAVMYLSKKENEKYAN